MAEKLVSPGVFTRENDLSFIAQGVGQIGAAIVGPFKQGPAFKPTIVTTQSELTDIFGAADGTYYTNLTAQNYLREAGVVTICRVGGIGGYTDENSAYIVATSGSNSAVVGVLYSTAFGSVDGTTLYVHQNSGTGFTSFQSGETVHVGSVTATIASIAQPEINLRSGELLYIENISPVTRNENQTEDIRLVLEL